VASLVIDYGSASQPLSHKYSNHGTLVELVWRPTRIYRALQVSRNEPHLRVEVIFASREEEHKSNEQKYSTIAKSQWASSSDGGIEAELLGTTHPAW